MFMEEFEEVPVLFSRAGLSTKETAMGSNRCCNCNRSFGPDCLPTKQFYYEFFENGNLVKKDIMISDAVMEICQWRLFGFSGKATDEIFESFNQLKVCGNVCGVAIAKLYGAIKVFDSLANASSSLYLLTSKLAKAFLDSEELVESETESESASKTRRKQPPNFLGKDITSKHRVKKIASEILGRPITQYYFPDKKKARFIDSARKTLNANTVELHEEQVYDSQAQDPLQDSSELVQENFETQQSDYNDIFFESFETEKSECGDDFQSSIKLALRGKPYVSKPFLCHHCGAGLSSRQCLRTHQLLTHKIPVREDTKTHSCNICGKEFFFKYLLRNHQVSHAETRDHPCPSCDLKFKSKQRLGQHQRDVHGTEERKFACTMCPKAFKHHRTLWEHMHAFHGNKGSKVIFECKYGCGSTTSRSRSLLSHHRKCRKRPGAQEQKQGELEAAVESIVPDLLESGGANADDGRKRRQLYACKWDCGKSFTNLGYQRKHQKHICRKRPNQKLEKRKQNPREKVGRRRSPRVKEVLPVPPPTMKTNDMPEETPQQQSVLLEEPIEVETVFDDIITDIPS